MVDREARSNGRMKGTRRADTLDISGVAETMGKNGNFIRVNSATIRVRAGERITRLVIAPRALPYRIDPLFLRRFSHHGRSTSVREFPLRLRIKNNSNAFGNFSTTSSSGELNQVSRVGYFFFFYFISRKCRVKPNKKKENYAVVSGYLARVCAAVLRWLVLKYLCKARLRITC